MTDLAQITDAAAALHLEVLGGFACAAEEPGLPAGTRTLLMLGPREPGFWAHVTAQPEWTGSDAVDRWSRRVIGGSPAIWGPRRCFRLAGRPTIRSINGRCARGGSGTARCGCWCMGIRG